ncbi:hypothetical protein B0H66DRAFT_590611 [Apodospora peruviana]|uniref:MYND-type domain-containing protein n=1 Tax=Apodospora peruviana TaxID=516989 RepID=A0AAE0M9K5_9PEZI|nr:hypothetical protein B0H66DRAFT_590611 [Apodospora peruviana]
MEDPLQRLVQSFNALKRYCTTPSGSANHWIFGLCHCRFISSGLGLLVLVVHPPDQQSSFYTIEYPAPHILALATPPYDFRKQADFVWPYLLHTFCKNVPSFAPWTWSTLSPEAAEGFERRLRKHGVRASLCQVGVTSPEEFQEWDKGRIKVLEQLEHPRLGDITRCHGCGVSQTASFSMPPPFLSCARCLQAVYHSNACRVNDWKRHESNCMVPLGDRTRCHGCGLTPQESPSEPFVSCCRCLQAVYHSHECQDNHWNRHEPNCMVPLGDRTRCHGCGLTPQQSSSQLFVACGRCTQAVYHSSRCQNMHWRRHQQHCFPPPPPPTTTPPPTHGHGRGAHTDPDVRATMETSNETRQVLPDIPASEEEPSSSRSVVKNLRQNLKALDELQRLNRIAAKDSLNNLQRQSTPGVSEVLPDIPDREEELSALRSIVKNMDQDLKALDELQRRNRISAKDQLNNLQRQFTMRVSTLASSVNKMDKNLQKFEDRGGRLASRESRLAQLEAQ